MAETLPADWRDVLLRVRGWLAETTAQADRREEAFRAKFEAESDPAPATLAFRPRPLTEPLAPLARAAHEVDASADAVETGLREIVRRSQTLRLQLASLVDS